MTFQCYIPRSLQRSAIGAVFVTPNGVRRLIPDHWLAQAELSERGRLLRLIYTCCAIEVAGQHLEVLFEDAVAGRLGTICHGPPGPVPRDQPWVSSLVAVAPIATVPALESELLRC
jgi:hypothetical protein